MTPREFAIELPETRSQDGCHSKAKLQRKELENKQVTKAVTRANDLYAPFGLPKTWTEGKLLPPSAKWLPRPLSCQ